MFGKEGWTMMFVKGVGVLWDVKLWPLFVLTYTPLIFCVPLCQGSAYIYCMCEGGSLAVD